MTASERAKQINLARTTVPSLFESQDFWAADGIHTGAQLDAWIEWNAWKQAYRHVRDCRAPLSNWGERTAQEWLQETDKLWAEMDSLFETPFA
jgi:hypothetical protein